MGLLTELEVVIGSSSVRLELVLLFNDPLEYISETT